MAKHRFKNTPGQSVYWNASGHPEKEWRYGRFDTRRLNSAGKLIGGHASRRGWPADRHWASAMRRRLLARLDDDGDFMYSDVHARRRIQHLNWLAD